MHHGAPGGLDDPEAGIREGVDLEPQDPVVQVEPLVPVREVLRGRDRRGDTRDIHDGFIDLPVPARGEPFAEGPGTIGPEGPVGLLVRGRPGLLGDHIGLIERHAVPRLDVVQRGPGERRGHSDVFFEPDLGLIELVLEGPDDDFRHRAVLEFLGPEGTQTFEELLGVLQGDIGPEVEFSGGHGVSTGTKEISIRETSVKNTVLFLVTICHGASGILISEPSRTMTCPEGG